MRLTFFFFLDVVLGGVFLLWAALASRSSVMGWVGPPVAVTAAYGPTVGPCPGAKGEGMGVGLGGPRAATA